MGMTGVVRLSGTIRCAPEEARALAEAVAEHVALTRAEPGCLSFDIRPTADPCVYEVDETFRGRAAFEAHQARTRSSPWWTVTRHMSRDFEIAGQ